MEIEQGKYMCKYNEFPFTVKTPIKKDKNDTVQDYAEAYQIVWK